MNFIKRMKVYTLKLGWTLWHIWMWLVIISLSLLLIVPLILNILILLLYSILSLMSPIKVFKEGFNEYIIGGYIQTFFSHFPYLHILGSIKDVWQEDFDNFDIWDED